MPDADQSAVLQRRVLLRALAAGDFGLLHLRFNAGVIDAYRLRGAKLIRTRTVGRITMPQWSIDLGIAPGDAELHVVARDLLDRVPEAEHAHWVEHLILEPLSVNYLQMTIITAACIDDGDTEAWE